MKSFHSFHCRILILKSYVEPIYVRGISSELFLAISSVNNGASILYSQLKRGVHILEEVAMKNGCDVVVDRKETS